jgi:RNA polymerase sigma factor (sigma-70 family)
VTSDDATRVVEAVWRIESARLIAGLTRLVGDVGLAEDLAQDALEAALRQWPGEGVPPKPGAWLMSTAKHRAIDQLRRQANLARKTQQLGQHALVEEELTATDMDAAADDFIGDDLLRLMFICCHPLLSVEARTALTLRLLGGLTTDEIARAFLVPEPTIAQRITRAKKTLSAANVPFEVPQGGEFIDRLGSVLGVIYLVFNEGYTATAGERWVRPELLEEALRLGRVLAGLVPDEPEAHGLVALMEIQASRTPARVGREGEPIPLLEQDRGRWDWVLIGHGLAALERAQRLGRAPGQYALQAAIAACHARARTAEATDWERIVALYDGLASLTPSPVVELNRAVAVGMAFGPSAGLELADELLSEPSMKSYHLLPAVRADFLAKLGRNEEARSELVRAAAMTSNAAERQLLTRRALALPA